MDCSSGVEAVNCNLQIVSSDEGCVLVDVAHDRILKLNSVCVEIWKLLRAGDTETQVVQKIAQQYQVDERRVAEDVAALCTKIRGLRLSPTNSVLRTKLKSELHPNPQPYFPWYGQTAECESDQRPQFTMVIAGVLGLALFDLILSFSSFEYLCSRVNSWAVRGETPKTVDIVQRVCRSVQRACVWYPRRSLCLQRSAVTTCLLRFYGVAAQMVIGVRPMPFLAHAWVEVNGRVVNDWPKAKNFYSSLITR
jgi:hypothetical protein